MSIIRAEPRWLSHGRVPSLDGLRALAILLVLLSHSARAPSFPWPSDSLGLVHYGAVGVEVFFVLSGFLITLLLLREQHDTGAISLKGFYFRRSLRILPACGVYLLALFGLQLLVTVGLNGWDLASAL